MCLEHNFCLRVYQSDTRQNMCLEHNFCLRVYQSDTRQNMYLEHNFCFEGLPTRYKTKYVFRT